MPVVLYPHFKLAYVRYYFDEDHESIKAKEMGDKVEVTLTRLYDHYLLCHSSNIGVSGSLSQAYNEMNFDDMEEAHILTFQSKYSKHRKGIRRLESKSEVAKYLSKTCEEVENKFDVLGGGRLTLSSIQFYLS